MLNATEELLQGVEGEPRPSTTSVPTNTDPKKLDQQFSRLEENVSPIVFLIQLIQLVYFFFYLLNIVLFATQGEKDRTVTK